MGQRILVVDDDADLRNFLQDALSDDYDVTVAKEGYEALDQITAPEDSVDLVVTDLNMPNGLDGVELAQRLPSSLPWIVISGYLDVPQYQLGLERLSPSAILQKPFRLSQLKEAINAVLPAVFEQKPGPAAARIVPEPTVTHRDPGPSRILVIDDEDMVRGAVRKILEHGGYAVVEAIDGPEGLDRFDREHPDLVLVDLFMPGMTGVQVIAEMKRRNPDVKILTVSGSDVRDGMDTLTKAEEAGAAGILEKPFRMQALLDAVKRLLEDA